MTTNSNGTLTELTPKFKEINSALAYMYTKKKIRMQSPRRASA